MTILTCAARVCAAVLTACSALSAPLGAVEVAGRTFELVDVSDGLLVHYGRHEDASVANAADIANLVAVVGTRSVAIIDPGGSRAVSEALLAAVRARTALPISHVVLTHAHPDHVFGAAVFAGLADRRPEVIAHAGFAAARQHRSAADIDRFGALQPATAPLQPDVTVSAGDTRTIDLGERILQVLALPPAHTDHDLVVLDPASGTLIASDVVVGQRLPSLDGSLLGWLDALERIDAMTLQRVVPGHGRSARPAALLEPMIAYLTGLRDGVRDAIARGESLGRAIGQAESEGDGESRVERDVRRGQAMQERRPDPPRWQLYALHHPFNVTRAWAELEWE